MNALLTHKKISKAGGVAAIEVLIVVAMVCIVAGFLCFKLIKGNQTTYRQSTAVDFATYLQKARPLGFPINNDYFHSKQATDFLSIGSALPSPLRNVTCCLRDLVRSTQKYAITLSVGGGMRVATGLCPSFR